VRKAGRHGRACWAGASVHARAASLGGFGRPDCPLCRKPVLDGSRKPAEKRDPPRCKFPCRNHLTPAYHDSTSVDSISGGEMSARQNRAAMYLRVSRDDQTTENQRLVLARRWQNIVAGYGPNL
jgi:hypothetical protein